MQTDGSNHASNLRLWFNNQSCLSCFPHLHGCRQSVAKSEALHLELKGLANRWQQPRLQFTTLVQRPKLHFFLSSPARLPQSVAKSEAPHLELKGLANRWQQPHLHFRKSVQRPKLPCFLSSPARLPQSVAKSEALHLELKGLANRWQQPHLHFRKSVQRPKLPLLSVLTCTVAAICCKNPKLCIIEELKGLANRWQQPRL